MIRRLCVGDSGCEAPTAASAGRGLPVVPRAVEVRPGERAYRSEADMFVIMALSVILLFLFSYEREECSYIVFVYETPVTWYGLASVRGSQS